MNKRILIGMLGFLVCVWNAQAGPNVKIIGDEGSDAILKLNADQGDDLDDKWSIESEASGNDLTFNNGTVEVLNVTTTGVMTVSGGFVSTTNTLGGVTTVGGRVAVNAATNVITGGIYTNTATKTLTGVTSISGTYTNTATMVMSNATIKVGALQAYTNAMVVQQLYYVPGTIDGTNYNILCVF